MTYNKHNYITLHLYASLAICLYIWTLSRFGKQSQNTLFCSLKSLFVRRIVETVSRKGVY